MDYQEQESHSPVSHPGRTVASLPHDRWTFPFRQQKEQNSVYLERWLQQKEQNSMYLERWLQCGHWDVPGFSSGGMGWDGEQGTGSALHPGLQVLFLLFCLSGSAALNVVHNLQPTAEPPQNRLPRLPRKECARPSFPPDPRSLSSLGMQRCCAPSRTHQGVPAPTATLLSENTIGSLLVLLPTAPRADTSQLSREAQRGWRGVGLMPSCQHHLLLMSHNNIGNIHGEIIISYKRSSSQDWFTTLALKRCFMSHL